MATARDHLCSPDPELERLLFGRPLTIEPLPVVVTGPRETSADRVQRLATRLTTQARNLKRELRRAPRLPPDVVHLLEQVIALHDRQARLMQFEADRLREGG